MRFLPADFDDRLNPFLVKEARQLVRSKAVVGGQWTLLALAPAAMAGAYWRSMDSERSAGMAVFTAIHMVWVAVCVYGIPMYVGVRMACECADQAGIDMLRGMTLSATRIVLGKWMSGFLLGILALSVLAPFLAMSYFLRGVDLGMILVSVGVGCLQLAIGTFSALYVGSNGRGWATKILAALVYLLFTACLVGATSMLVLPSAITGSHLPMGGLVCFMVPAGVVLLVSYGLAVSSVKILLADKYARRYALERRAGAAGYWLGARLRQVFVPPSSSEKEPLPSFRA